MTAWRAAAATALAALLAAPLSTTTQASVSAPTSRYVVQLADPPLASYRGGVPGLEATNPAARGQQRLNVDTAASRAYLRYLSGRQDAAVSAAVAALGRTLSVPFRYRYAFNGFAAVLTAAEAERVRALPGVVDVDEETTRELLTDAGPRFIGAPEVWSGSAGPSATKGEGVVVGVIDTGINHTHPSFADSGGDGYDHTNPRGTFYGLCDPLLGAPFCNDKLIGAWDFTGTTPVDDNGHGSHTASTAAGNVVRATLEAPTVTLEKEISGVAPHANIISYKACLVAGCVSASTTAAIDQAVADEVDVINYSIGGGPTNPWDDPDSEAFLGARDAGVFAAVSGGNDGPRAETVGSPANAPWVTTVAASTHDRALENALSGLSGGATAPPADIVGKSLTAGYGPAPVVYAEDHGDRLCGAPFTPGTFDGEIVVCERGVNPRVEKGRNVELGGAGGMVLANSEAEGADVIGDAHELPAVHIAHADAVRLEDWVRDGGTGHTATIAGTTLSVAPENGDVMAGFSSRGPNKPALDVLKPDISGPGVDVLAAYKAPEQYGVISGTSMSSPHLAGAAALVRALHPDWTPTEVQSALMTTAKSATMRKEDGVRPADAFDMGAGRVDLTQAGRAGFVLDEQAPDYTAADPTAGGDPTALNVPHLTDADCDGTCTWTRTLRGTTTATWSVRTSGPRGLRLSVSPSRFTLAAGGTQTVTITADVKGLPVGRYVLGQIDLSSKDAPKAHFPVVVLPGGAPTPVDAETTSPTGSTVASFTTPIRIKDLSSRVYGLAQGKVETPLVPQDPTPLSPYDTTVGTSTTLLDAPAGTRFLTAEIADTTAIDLDLYVGIDQNGNGVAESTEEICASASSTAFESCTLPNPDGGRYWVLVQNWLGTGVDEVELVASVIPGTDEGNLTVTGPASAVEGSTLDLTLTWDEPDLDAAETWFALVEVGSDKRHTSNAGALLLKLSRTS